MNTDEHRFKQKDLTGEVIRVFYDVYNELGQGFLESVYEEAMYIALTEAGLPVGRQVLVPVWFRERVIGEFKADLLVADAVLLELKATRNVDEAHERQLLNELRATPIEVGLLLNFGRRPEVRRFIFDNARKAQRGKPVEPGLDVANL